MLEKACYYTILNTNKSIKIKNHLDWKHLLFPGRGQNPLGLVVAGQTVDSAFHKNQTELGIFVLSKFKQHR